VWPAEMACGLHFCAGMVAAIPCMNVRAEQALLDRIEGDLNLARLPPLLWYDVLLELVREPGRAAAAPRPSPSDAACEVQPSTLRRLIAHKPELAIQPHKSGRLLGAVGRARVAPTSALNLCAGAAQQ